MNLLSTFLSCSLIALAACNDRASFETVEPGNRNSRTPSSDDSVADTKPLNDKNDRLVDPKEKPNDDQVKTDPIEPVEPNLEPKIPPKEIGDVNDFPNKLEEKIKHNCQTETVKTISQKVLFANPGKTCDWTKGTNLSRIDLQIRARREQFVPLTGLGNGIVCSMNFEFPKQDMLYDDEIFLLYNNTVLTSSINYNQYFGEKNGLSFYDWSKIRGVKYSARERNSFCLGRDTELGLCSMPYTETAGSMVLSFHDELIYKISAATNIKLDALSTFSLTAGHERYEGQESAVPGDFTDKERGIGFTFVTLGDNDNSDCQHKPFEFTVNLKYIDNPNP
jgi:hypothetical protein